MDIYFSSIYLQLAAIVFIVSFVFISYKKPCFAALLFPIILPFYLAKLYIFNLLDIAIAVFLIANIGLLKQGFYSLWKNKLGRFLLFSIFFLLFSTLAGTVFGVNKRVALGSAKSWFFLPIFLFFTLLPILANSRLRFFRQRFLSSLALSGAATVLMSLPFVFENLYTYDSRLSGIFLSPNHLAMALVPGILALIILNYESRIMNHEKAIAFLLLLSLELLILYSTYSYGAWFGLIAAFLFLLHVSGFKPASSPLAGFQVSKKSSRYYLIAILFLSLIFLSQLHNPKLTHILNGDYYSSLHSRTMIWQSALAISKHYWLFGIGGGNFQQVYLDYQKYFSEPYIEWAVPQPHNIFLAFMTQMGIVGLISFLFIVGLTLCYFLCSAVILSLIVIPAQAGIQKKKNFVFKILYFIGNWNLFSRKPKNNLRKLDNLSFWSLAYLIYIIIHGLIDTPYFKNDLAILFWLALAAIWNLPNFSSPQTRGGGRHRRPEGLNE